MKTIQVKPGKPSKFYINNKRINLNTAFGMYQKGAKFTVNGKKINLNNNLKFLSQNLEFLLKKKINFFPVSYTHLTLPTIYSV